MKKQKNTRNYGLHLTIDGYHADSKKLGDIDLLFRTLDKLPEIIGMHKIGFPHLASFEEKEIAGISGIVMIVESHITIHTYTKKDFISADVYSCKQFDPKKIIDYLRSVYKIKKMDINLIDRGKNFPVHNLHD